MDNIHLYFDLGMSQKEIRFTLAHKHNIIISERTLKRKLKELGLSRRSYSDISDVIMFIDKTLKTSGRLHDYRWMFHTCEVEGLKVRKEDVRLILAALDPQRTALRSTKTLHRRRYSCTLMLNQHK